MNQTNAQQIAVGDIVLGPVCGTFKVVGLATIGGEAAARIRAYNPATQQVARGQLALPIADLRKA